MCSHKEEEGVTCASAGLSLLRSQHRHILEPSWKELQLLIQVPQFLDSLWSFHPCLLWQILFWIYLWGFFFNRMQLTISTHYQHSISKPFYTKLSLEMFSPSLFHQIFLLPHFYYLLQQFPQRLAWKPVSHVLGFCYSSISASWYRCL